jgi:hypothetical protein
MQEAFHFVSLIVREMRSLPDHHHHQITKLSHSINAIGPAPHRGGRKREHRSIVYAHPKLAQDTQKCS